MIRLQELVMKILQLIQICMIVPPPENDEEAIANRHKKFEMD